MSSVPLISIVDDDDALSQSLDDLIRAIGFRARLCSAEAFEFQRTLQHGMSDSPSAVTERANRLKPKRPRNDFCPIISPEYLWQPCMMPL